MWRKICLPYQSTRYFNRFWWVSCCSELSFLYCILYTVVCLFWFLVFSHGGARFFLTIYEFVWFLYLSPLFHRCFLCFALHPWPFFIGLFCLDDFVAVFNVWCSRISSNVIIQFASNFDSYLISSYVCKTPVWLLELKSIGLHNVFKMATMRKWLTIIIHILLLFYI